MTLFGTKEYLDNPSMNYKESKELLQNSFDIVDTIQKSEDFDSWILKAHWIGGISKEDAQQIWLNYWDEKRDEMIENETDDMLVNA